jgi:hypothetical protein
LFSPVTWVCTEPGKFSLMSLPARARVPAATMPDATAAAAIRRLAFLANLMFSFLSWQDNSLSVRHAGSPTDRGDPLEVWGIHPGADADVQHADELARKPRPVRK